MNQKQYLAVETEDLQVGRSFEIQLSLPSLVTEISPFVDQLMGLLKPELDRFYKEDGSDIDIEVAVQEAIANAVIHGNHEIPEKRVHVECSCSLEGEVLITVRDEGEGFDSNNLPDPTDPANLLLSHGRGVRLMQTLMDEVRFEENGTIVRMRKLLRLPLGQQKLALGAAAV